MKKIKRVIYKVDRHGKTKKVGSRIIILNDDSHGMLFNKKKVIKIDKKWLYYV